MSFHIQYIQFFKGGHIWLHKNTTYQGLMNKLSINISFLESNLIRTSIFPITPYFQDSLFILSIYIHTCI